MIYIFLVLGLLMCVVAFGFFASSKHEIREMGMDLHKYNILSLISLIFSLIFIALFVVGLIGVISL